MSDAHVYRMLTPDGWNWVAVPGYFRRMNETENEYHIAIKLHRRARFGEFDSPALHIDVHECETASGNKSEALAASCACLESLGFKKWEVEPAESRADETGGE